MLVSCAAFFLQDSGEQHLDFDNPLYREMTGLDLPQNPNDIFFLPDSNTVRYLITIVNFRGYTSYLNVSTVGFASPE